MKIIFFIALAVLVCVCWLPVTRVGAEEGDEAALPEGATAGVLLADFDDVKASAKRWMTVNDNVMGGKSKGGPSFGDGLLTFKGATNTDGGGFSSLRTRPSEIDLSGTAGLLLRVKGDGRTYKASLRTDAKYRGSAIAFRASFETVEDEWVTVFVPFDAFTPSWRGQSFRNPPTLELDKVKSMGLMIYDKKDGAFELQVDWIVAAEEGPGKVE